MKRFLCVRFYRQRQDSATILEEQPEEDALTSVHSRCNNYCYVD